MQVIGDPPDLEIEAMYAFVAVEDGKEGVIAQSMGTNDDDAVCGGGLG